MRLSSSFNPDFRTLPKMSEDVLMIFKSHYPKITIGYQTLATTYIPSCLELLVVITLRVRCCTHASTHICVALASAPYYIHIMYIGPCSYNL